MIADINVFLSFLKVNQSCLGATKNVTEQMTPFFLRNSDSVLGGIMKAYGPLILSSFLIFAVLWGFVSMSIARNKGYDSGDDKSKWFLVGFVLGVIGVIIAACQPNICTNGNSNGNNVIVKSSESTADEIKKFKELLDAGVITEQEFQAKKDQLLKYGK